MDSVALALVLAGASFAISGVMLLVRSKAVVSAVLLSSVAWHAVVAAVLGGRDSDSAAETGWILAVGLLFWRSRPTRWSGGATQWTSWRSWCWPVAASPPCSGRVGAGVVGLVQGTVLLAYVWWRIETSSGRERRAVQWMAIALGSPA